MAKAVFAQVGQTAILIVTAVLVGWLSAWYMFQTGSSLTTRTSGPWTSWVSAARTEADPYTRAHFARSGSLPLSADISRIWLARQDSEGQRLHSSCTYEIIGTPIEADWWSITPFDDKGRLIANEASRYSYTSETVALNADGTFRIALARDARPGNWLPTGGAGRLALMLTIIDQNTLLHDEEGTEPTGVPEIKRIGCR